VNDARTTHATLVARATKWLRNTVGCDPVFAEFVTSISEIPDAIGWKYGCLSVLVECKASRSDFLADRKKFSRRAPDYGIGDRRYYMTPPGLVTAEEVPDGWGLLYAAPRCVEVVRFSCVQGEVRRYKNEWWFGASPFKSNKHQEMKMLVSALRRCGLRWDISEIQQPLSKPLPRCR
jgi:hypothetical protein